MDDTQVEDQGHRTHKILSAAGDLNVSTPTYMYSLKLWLYPLFIINVSTLFTPAPDHQ